MIHNEDEQILIHFHNVEFHPNDHDQYDAVYLLILEPTQIILSRINIIHSDGHRFLSIENIGQF